MRRNTLILVGAAFLMFVAGLAIWKNFQDERQKQFEAEQQIADIKASLPFSGETSFAALGYCFDVMDAYLRDLYEVKNVLRSGLSVNLEDLRRWHDTSEATEVAIEDCRRYLKLPYTPAEFDFLTDQNREQIQAMITYHGMVEFQFRWAVRELEIRNLTP